MHPFIHYCIFSRSTWGVMKLFSSSYSLFHHAETTVQIGVCATVPVCVRSQPVEMIPSWTIFWIIMYVVGKERAVFS